MAQRRHDIDNKTNTYIFNRNNNNGKSKGKGKQRQGMNASEMHLKQKSIILLQLISDDDSP